MIGAYVALLLALMGRTTYDVWGGLLIAPALVLLSLPALRRQVRREGDPRLLALLLAAVVIKLGGGVARYVLGFVLYNNRGDAYAYHTDAVVFSKRLASGELDLGSFIESPESFISSVTGIAYSLFRPSVLAGFLLFSWFAFWGLFWFYRAFRIAVPEGRARTYGKFVFFLPSVVFWPSSIGKEAWMLFALGLAGLGVAQLMTGSRTRGVVSLGVGLLGTSAVRPHYAGIVALALASAYVIRKPAASLRQLAPIVKLVSVAGVVVVAVFFLQRTEAFLEQSGLSVEGGLASIESVRTALGDAAVQTEQGGSEFAAPGLGSPTGILLSVGTVLFRPLPTEADNPQVLVAALESTVLLVLMVVRFRWVVAAVRSMRRRPYVAFLGAYLAGGVLVLSSVANFGILSRQRTLIMPAVVVLLSIPPKKKRVVARASRRRDEPVFRAGVGG